MYLQMMLMRGKEIHNNTIAMLLITLVSSNFSYFELENDAIL